MWQPSASLHNLQFRADFLNRIRQFFTQRGYLEVETPVLSHFGVTDPYLNNIKARFRQQDCFLQTSPEYHMKRLLAAGSGPIFQLARVFRDDELGRWHNPEFTMLEWYKPQVDHFFLIEEVDTLLQELLNSAPAIKKTYQQVFQEICDLNPFTAPLKAMQEVLLGHNLGEVLAPDEQDRDQFLFLLMSHVIEPALASVNAPLVIYGFPPSQAALAKIENGLASRFEFYFRGVELANGFHELSDALVQQQRFKQDLKQRAKMNAELPEIDSFLLEAMKQGLPACSGVALGVDRLLALALNHDCISSVVSFDYSRA